ncbi:unnamed protein product [Ilex paraguariensis]|uniref:Uncharacterized protein n=1 Tax=Ilex paraguariensis TaxID=185542 RepID=A0ABC8TX54_9AQUA
MFRSLPDHHSATSNCHSTTSRSSSDEVLTYLAYPPTTFWLPFGDILTCSAILRQHFGRSLAMFRSPLSHPLAVLRQCFACPMAIFGSPPDYHLAISDCPLRHSDPTILQQHSDLTILQQTFGRPPVTF